MNNDRRILINFRVTSEFRAAIKVAAAREQMSMDSWIRHLILREIKRQQKEIQPVRVGGINKSSLS